MYVFALELDFGFVRSRNLGRVRALGELKIVVGGYRWEGEGFRVLGDTLEGIRFG